MFLVGFFALPEADFELSPAGSVGEGEGKLSLEEDKLVGTEADLVTAFSRMSLLPNLTGFGLVTV